MALGEYVGSMGSFQIGLSLQMNVDSLYLENINNPWYGCRDNGTHMIYSKLVRLSENDPHYLELVTETGPRYPNGDAVITRGWIQFFDEITNQVLTRYPRIKVDKELPDVPFANVQTRNLTMRLLEEAKSREYIPHIFTIWDPRNNNISTDPTIFG